MLLICIIAIGALSYFLHDAMEDMISVMNMQIMRDRSALLTHQTKMYLDIPHDATRLVARSFSGHSRPAENDIRQILHHVISVDINKSRYLSRISFASAEGNVTGFSLSPGTNKPHMVLTASDYHGAPTLRTHMTPIL